MNYMLAFDGLEFWRRTAPDRAAMVMDGRTVDYRTLGRWTDAVAAKLASAGVKAGDVVGVSGVNSIQWVVAAMASLKAGAIVAPYNARFVESEFRHLVEVTEPAALFADAGRLELLREIGGARPVFSLEALDELSEAPAAPWSPRRVDADDPAFIIFTSGSTGTPKGVILTHTNILAGFFERKLMEAAFRPGMKRLSVLGLHGAPGSVWGMLSALVNGGTFYLHTRFDPEAALSTIIEEKITIFSGVPLLFEQMAKLPAFKNADLSSLESVHVGGAPVTEALLETWRAKGVLLRQIYGMTETCGLASVSTDEEVMTGAPTCGPGGVFTRLRVVDAEGRDLPPGEIGQALIRGPTCTPGYWRDEKATREFIVNGWLQTGDRGVMDEQGRFRYVDRLKDLIISGGYNISPAEIEAVVAAFAPQAEVAAIPVPDEKFGETPGVCIHSPATIDASAVVAHCNANLADYKVPRYVFTHDEPLPRLASGKIDKLQLKARYADAATRFAKVR